MKVWIKAALLCAAAFLILMPARLQAASVHVRDDSGLLTDEGVGDIEREAQRIAEKYDINVVVLTSDEYGYSDNYARDLIEETGSAMYPEGYIGYMINMADRSYWVDAYGDRLRDIFDQSAADKLAESSFDYLADGDYYGAMKEFLYGVDVRMDIKTSPMGALKKPFIYKGWTLAFLGGSGVIALVAAGAWTYSKASKHQDKGIALNASQYANPLNLRHHQDRFVRTYQTRVRVPESNSGSGGGFSGGGGGGGHTGSGGHF